MAETTKKPTIMDDIVFAQKLAKRLMYTAQTKQLKLTDNGRKYLGMYLNAVNDQLMRSIELVDHMKNIEINVK